MAERVAEQVPKGSSVCVQGKLNDASWTNREGKKQTKFKVCWATMPTLLRQVERSNAYVAYCSLYKALRELLLTLTALVNRCHMLVDASEAPESKRNSYLHLVVQINATEVRFVDRAPAPAAGQQQGGWGQGQPQQAGWGQPQQVHSFQQCRPDINACH